MATIQKKTSPNGFVTPDASGDSARLWDFDIDGAEPKAHHKTLFLDGLIRRIQQNPSGPWKIWLAGFTDRLGDATYNLGLSQRRMAAVRNYIKQRLPRGATVVFDPPGWYGEERTPGQDNVPDAHFRAVDIALTIGDAPVPPKPPKPVVPGLVFPKRPNIFIRPPKNSRCVVDCPPATEFSLTVLRNASLGEGLEIARTEFLLRDTKNRLEVIYIMDSMGFGFSPLPIGVSLAGEPKTFSTGRRPVRVTRFGPKGSMATVPNPVDPRPGQTLTTIELQFLPDESLPQMVTLFNVDMGVGVPGLNLHKADVKVSLTNSCGPKQASRF